MSIERVNSDLRRLWHTHATQHPPLWMPLQYGAIAPGGLIFVGCNPSFSHQGWSQVLAAHRRASPAQGPHARLDPAEVFAWSTRHQFNLENALALEAMAHAHLGYFRWHREVARVCERPWTNIDLFAWRETTQSALLPLVLRRPFKELQLTEFGEAQITVFNQLMALAQPTAVIVCNAFASSLYWTHRRVEFDPSVGHYWDETEGRRVPLFLSGMLTGGRALDVFSRQRLLWQVAMSLGKPWTPPPLLPSEDLGEPGIG